MSELPPHREIWNLDKIEYSDAILETIEEFNDVGYEALMSRIPERKVGPHGIRYLEINPKGSSTSEAIVVFNPFNNGVKNKGSGMQANNMLKAQFLRDAAERAGVHDEKGNPLPVIMISTPTVGSTVNQSFSELNRVRKGELWIPTKKKLEIIQHKGIERVAVGGHSRGSLDTLDSAPLVDDMGMEIISMAPTDVVASQKKKPHKMMLQLMASLDEIQMVVEQAGVEPFEIAQGWGSNPDKSVQIGNQITGTKGLVSHAAGIAAGFGLTKGGTETRIEKALDATDAPMTVTYSQDPLLDPKALEKILDEHPEIKQVAIMGKGKSEDGKKTVGHSWNDNAPANTAAALDPLLRAKKK